jgi:hypothetical protein
VTLSTSWQSQFYDYIRINYHLQFFRILRNRAGCKFSAEWLYRLISEPRRIKRQKVLPVFAVWVVLAKLKGLGKVD